MRKKRKQTYLDHTEIELDDLGNHKCQARQAIHCPGSSKRLNSLSEETDEVNECQVTRNVSPTQDEVTKNDVSTESEKNGEVSVYRVTRNATVMQDKVGENENDVDDVQMHQVIRNVTPVQDKNGEGRNGFNTSNERNKKVDEHLVTINATSMVDKVSENEKDFDKASGRNLEVERHQVIRNVTPLQDKNAENRNGFNAASGRNRTVDCRQVTRNATSTEDKVSDNEMVSNKVNGRNLEVDRHQITRNTSCNEDKEGNYRNGINIASGNSNFQIRCSPRTSVNNRCIPEESNQVFRRDILDVQYVSEEDKWKNEVTENKNYFLEKHELQMKCPFERNARPHPTKPDSAQALIHSSKLASFRRVSQHHATPEQSFRVDEENCRRDSQLRDDVTHKVSSLDQRVTVDQQRLKDMRSEYIHSHAVKNMDFWIIIGGLFLTFLTAVSVVMGWEYLTIIFLRRRLSSNSSSIPEPYGTDFSRT